MGTLWTFSRRFIATAAIAGVALSAMPLPVWSGTGAADPMVIHDASTSSGLRYGMDRVARPLIAVASQEAAPAAPPIAIATSERAARAIALGAGPTRVPLASPAPAAATAATLASRLQSLGPDRQIYLLLQDLKAEEQPGVLYNLYLDLPEGVVPARGDPHYLGTLNFFNATSHGDYGARPAAGPSHVHSIDVTETVANLQAMGLLSDRTTVTIIPAGTPAPDARPVVGRIELVAQ